MGAQTGHTVLGPGGIYNTKDKTYTGSGHAPAGYKKVSPPKPSEVPTVTTSPSGQITTSGFSSEKSARRAQHRQRTAIRTERRKTRAVNLTRRNAAERRRITSQSEARLKSTERAVKSHREDSQRFSPAAKFSSPSKSSTASQGGKSATTMSSTARKSGYLKPGSKPKAFKGLKTAGSPSLKELQVASSRGRLKTNERGYLTTPRVRKASRELKQARRVARKQAPRVEGPLTQGQKVFAREVSRRTGLSPRVIAAQALAEESGTNATRREAEGNHNWLNIGYFDSGPGGITQDPTWSNPKSAAKATAEFFKGKRYGPSEGIRNIIRSRGQSDQAQIDAIANSGWATSDVYRQSIEGTHALVSAKPGNPKAAKRLKTAKAQAAQLGLTKGKQPKKGRVPSVVYIGKRAEKKFPNLVVGENPAFGGVAPVHVSGSYHYKLDKKGRGEAIDVSGPSNELMAFDQWVAKKWGKGVTELFYDPGVSIKEGQEIGAIGGHGDHVHVAVAMPGQSFEGGYTAGAGGAVFVGYGGTASEAAESSQRAIKAAGKGKAKRVSPWKRYWRIKGRLRKAGVGEGKAVSTEEGTSPTLRSLELRYGVKTG